jgi:ubiquinone/menaquinone biosynthesis C-methylase UbiE
VLLAVVLLILLIVDLSHRYGYLKLFKALLKNDDIELYNYGRELIVTIFPGKYKCFMNHGYWRGFDEEEPQRRLAEYLFHSAKIRPTDRVLSLGSGLGGLEEVVIDNVKPASLIGIDINSGNIDFATKRAKQIGISEYVTYMQGDATNLPQTIAAKSFDRVLCLEAVNDISDQFSFIKEVSRVLKDDGVFTFAAETIKREPYTKLQKKMLDYDEKLWSYKNGILRNNWLVQYLISAGFGDIEMESIVYSVFPHIFEHLCKNKKTLTMSLKKKKYPLMTFNMTYKFYNYLDQLTKDCIYDYVIVKAKKSKYLNFKYSVSTGNGELIHNEEIENSINNNSIVTM